MDTFLNSNVFMGIATILTALVAVLLYYWEQKKKKRKKQILDTGHGFEGIKIKKYEKGTKPGGKRAYEESVARNKISRMGKLAKERLIINRKRKKKIHKVWEKDDKGNWVLLHNEEKKL